MVASGTATRPTSGSARSSRVVAVVACSEFPVSSDIALQNLTLTNPAITESPCGTNTIIRNITLNNSQNNSCQP
jgi:hypothetical protein